MQSVAPAQAVVDKVIGEYPNLLDILIHVMPPRSLKNVVIAAHLPEDLGEVSGSDDLGVVERGKPLVAIQKDGVRIGVMLQLRDAHRRVVAQSEG